MRTCTEDKNIEWDKEAIAPLNKTYLANRLNFDQNLINVQH